MGRRRRTSIREGPRYLDVGVVAERIIAWGNFVEFVAPAELA